MSSLLSSYESDFKITLDRVRSDLLEVGRQQKGQKNVLLKQIEEQKDELLDLLDQMEIEVTNSVSNVQERATYKNKLREYKNQIQVEIKKPLQKLMDERDQELLFGSAADGDNLDGNAYMDESQRQQLLANHAVLNKTGDRLTEATRIATETEDVGVQIMNDLRSQRETLENARQTLFQADSYVDKSMKTLKTMSRRLVANKFISYAIIAVLVLLILLVLFSKFK